MTGLRGPETTALFHQCSIERWTAAGMLEAEKQFRKVIGYTDLPRLAIAIEQRLHLQQPNHAPTQEAAIAVTV
jgi:hypothetical protein